MAPISSTLPTTPMSDGSDWGSKQILIVDGLDKIIQSEGELQPDGTQEFGQQQQARYRPAYELLDGSLEREGRKSIPASSTTNQSESMRVPISSS